MNWQLALGAALAVLLALVHSIRGERLMFRHLRGANETPLQSLSSHRIATIRSSRHMLSLFGFGFAAMFWLLADKMAAPELRNNLCLALAVSFLLSGLYWIWGTRGRHPACIVLLALSLLCFMAMQ